MEDALATDSISVTSMSEDTTAADAGLSPYRPNWGNDSPGDRSSFAETSDSGRPAPWV